MGILVLGAFVRGVFFADFLFANFSLPVEYLFASTSVKAT